MRRRVFLYCGIFGISILAINKFGSRAKRILFNREIEIEDIQFLKLDQIFREILASAQAIGNCYLNSSLSDFSYYRLCKSLDLIDVVYEKSTDKTEIQQIIRSKCQSDFYNGRTLIIDGCLISEAEINLCALLTLINDNKEIEK